MSKALELAKFGRETPPTGVVVGDTDAQTLSSKTFSDGPVFSALNANGVPFLNASKVLSSSATFVFDGANLGVGTPTPSVKLDVVGTIKAGVTSSISLYDSNVRQTGASTPLYIGTAGAGFIQFYNNDANTVYISATGNVGIGTNNPDYRLTVARGNESTGQVGLANFRTEATGSATYNAGVQIFGTASATAANRLVSFVMDADGADAAGGNYFYITKTGGDGRVDLIQASNAPMGFAANYVGRGVIDMTLSAAGNLGLGTTPSTGAKFQVTGYTDFWNTTNTLLRVQHDGTHGKLQSYIGGGVGNIVLNPDGGNVGIGVTPQTALQVNGTVRASTGFQIGADKNILQGNSYTGALTANDIVISAVGETVIWAYDVGQVFNVKASGELVINQQAANYNFRVRSSGDANMLFVNASTNRVGIGTSTPNAKLSINTTSFTAAANTAQVAIENTEAWSQGLAFYIWGAGFYNQGYASGYIGAPNTSSRLFVSGGARAIDNPDGNGQWAKTLNATAASFLSVGNGDTIFYGNTGLTANTAYTPTQRMVLMASGNLGIGTTNPAAKLTVKGQTHTAPWLAVERNGSGTLQFRIFNAENTGYSASSGTVSAPWTNVIDSSNSDFMITTALGGGTGGNIVLDGKVGIGTTGPSGPLHVHQSNGGPNTITMSTSFGNGNSYALNPFIQGISNGGFSIRDVTNGVDRIAIAYSSGNVGINTSYPNYKLHVNGTSSFEDTIKHKKFTTHVYENLNGGYYAGYTEGNSARYEIARIAIDYNDWNSVGQVIIELNQIYFSVSGHSKWAVNYGYVQNSKLSLLETVGDWTGATVTIGTPVQVSGDIYYLPIYVNVYGYYQFVARLTTSHFLSADNAIPSQGTISLQKSPTITNAGAGYASLAIPDYSTTDYDHKINGRFATSYYAHNWLFGGDRFVQMRGGKATGSGTWTLFSRGNSSAQSSGKVYMQAIYGTPSTAGSWEYVISGDKNISLISSNTSIYVGSTPSIYWEGNSLKVNNSNGSVYYSIIVELHNIGIHWDAAFGDFPGFLS